MIPIVNFAEINNPDQIDTIKNASSKWGVFYLENTGIPITKMLKQTNAFFDLPLEEKEKLSIKKFATYNGYIKQGNETTRGIPSRKESLAFAQELDLKYSDYPFAKLYGANQWPHANSLSDFKQDVSEYIVCVEKVANQLIRIIAQSLDIRLSDYHLYYHEPLHFRMKPARYKRIKDLPSTTLLVNKHTDMSLFNILLLDSPGLEIRDSAEEWHQIPPLDKTFVVLLGELMQMWTNDVYKACVHQVHNNFPKDQRTSIPFFFYPSLLSSVKIIDKPVKEELVGEMLFKRLNSIY